MLKRVTVYAAKWIAIALVAGLTMVVGHGAIAQQVAREGVPVKIANRTIIILRGPIAGYTAKERATSTMERIEAALAAEHMPTVTIEDVEGGTRVLLGGKHAFLVTKVDIDEQAGETTQIVARETVKRLDQAIAERREQETPRYLATAAAFSAVVTLLYGALLWVLFRLNRLIRQRLELAAETHSTKLHVSGVHLLDPRSVLSFTRRLLTLAVWLTGLILTSGWVTFVLAQFPYTRPWSEQLEGNLFAIAKEIALAMVGAVPGLLFVVVIVLIARAVIRMMAVFFNRVEQGRLNVGWIDADTARPTRRIFNFLIWVFVVAMAYPYLPGAQTDAFKGLSVLVGLMVSLGASSVVGQAFNGLILMFTRAYRSGDFVRIGETEGTVIELGMFATRIRTGLGEEIMLPNSSIMAASVKNYSRTVPGTGCIIDTVVTIGYSTPWRQVHAMLEEAARRTPDISATPAPIVRQTALSDYYVEYRLVAYTAVESPAQRVDVLNQLHGQIQDVFNEYGVQIMSPHYMMDPAAAQVVPKKDWYLAPARPPGTM